MLLDCFIPLTKMHNDQNKGVLNEKMDIYNNEYMPHLFWGRGRCSRVQSLPNCTQTSLQVDTLGWIQILHCFIIISLDRVIHYCHILSVIHAIILRIYNHVCLISAIPGTHHQIQVNTISVHKMVTQIQFSVTWMNNGWGTDSIRRHEWKVVKTNFKGT